jgi:hypothetical protein
MKRIALVVAVLLAACGTEKAPDDAGTGPVADPGSSIPFASFRNSVATAKIAAKTLTQVFQPAAQYDASTDTTLPLACGDAACPTGPNATCRNTLCGLMVDQATLLFVRNVATPVADFKLPCDGRTYSVEVYGTDGTLKVLESHVASVTMTSPCTTAITPTWTTKDFVATPADAGISYTIPTIYMGMEAPNNDYTVAVNGIVYPWSRAGWSLAESTLAAPVVRGTLATFTVPPAMSAPASFTFNGKFLLDASLTVGDEANTGRWWIQVAGSTVPVAAGTVNLPP